MAHAVTQPTKPFRSQDGALEVVPIPTGHDNLSWILIGSGGQAAVVDGPDAEATLSYCRSRGLELTTVVNTHTHFDHVGINADLARRGLLPRLRVIGPAKVSAQVPGITDHVNDGDRVDLFGCQGRVLLTEGHINGHVSYVFSDLLFCGDTLFAGGCGYLFDGPPARMFASLSRLAELDAATHVCCAHEYTQDNLRFAWSVEPDNDALSKRIREVWALRAEGHCTLPSTIGLELATNPFLRVRSKTIRESVARAMPERSLGSDADVFAALRALKDAKHYRQSGDERLPL